MGKKHSEESKAKMRIVHIGKKHSDDTKKKMSEGRRGEKSPVWKGDKVSYRGLHYWIADKLGKPDTCEHCRKSGLRGHFIHWANKSGEYKRDLQDWIRLCRSCHGKYDSRKKMSEGEVSRLSTLPSLPSL